MDRDIDLCRVTELQSLIRTYLPLRVIRAQSGSSTSRCGRTVPRRSNRLSTSHIDWTARWADSYSHSSKTGNLNRPCRHLCSCSTPASRDDRAQCAPLGVTRVDLDCIVLFIGRFPLFINLMADFTMVNPEIVWGAQAYSTIVMVLYMQAKWIP